MQSKYRSLLVGLSIVVVCFATVYGIYIIDEGNQKNCMIWKPEHVDPPKERPEVSPKVRYCR